jgi:uncharacterized protein
MAKTRNKIDRVVFQAVGCLKEYFNIKEVVLFGSQLTSKANKFSDIDLAVISPDFKNKYLDEIITILAEVSISCNSAVEIHPYSSDELKEARPSNFLGQILKTGKVVYRA